MQIILASSEVVPFAKTGGLADVCGALPVELEKLGHEAIVFLPAYTQAINCGLELNETSVEFDIPVGAKLHKGQLLESKLPGSNVRVYLVRQPNFFERDGLYAQDGEDFGDNCARFTFFCRSILEAIRLLDLKPDLIHANDWQTGLLPAYLKTEFATLPVYNNISTLFTIHNLAYQGSFWHWDILLTGMDWKYFNWREMEFFGRLNLLKTGLVFADKISTVSPTYAKEIQGVEQGCGLQGVLQDRSEDLVGILNGIDSTSWNPALDSHLPVQFGAENWQAGKAQCKSHLQQRLGLKQDPKVPLVGIVGRLAAQKGWSLILPIIKSWLETRDVQWAILGTGDADYHVVLETLNCNYPTKIAAKLEFSNELAHQIEAGADMFVMPSEYEPCGLNQMYSMAYGTVPVVRSTGGLADTVIDCNVENCANGTANGFQFDEFSTSALEKCLDRAVNRYLEEKDTWSDLVHRGMTTDWSWTQSAKRYESLYQEILNARKGQRLA